MRISLASCASSFLLLALAGCSSGVNHDGAASAGGAPSGGNSAGGSAGSSSGSGASGGSSTSSGGTAGTAGGTSGGSAGTGVGGATGGSAGAAGAGGGGAGGAVTGPLPPVYDEEDTGADCPESTLPDYEALPEVSHLPDPFEKADGARIVSRADWRCRRAEIKAELEKWDVGEKPGKPSVFTPSLDGNTISITVGEGANTFKISTEINRPNGAPSGPIPAIIGINTPTGSLPADVFSSRGIATITYHSDQLAPGLGGVGARTATSTRCTRAATPAS